MYCCWSSKNIKFVILATNGHPINMYIIIHVYMCSGAERARMMEMLRRVEEESVREDAGLEEGEEEGDSQSLEERLAGLDLGVIYTHYYVFEKPPKNSCLYVRVATPVLKAGHPGVPCYICLFVWAMVG